MSFQTRMLSAHACSSAALMVAFLAGCGPHHEGGGSGGEAGVSAGAGGASTGGDAGTSGSAVGGSTAGSGTAGSGGVSGPGMEPVIGCPAAEWPAEGLSYQAPPYSDSSDPAIIKLNLFSPTGISGDGRVVTGATRDPESDSARPVPASFTVTSGVTLLPAPEGALSREGFAQRPSCDGSVILEHERFGDVHRAEGNHAPRVIHDARLDTLAMDPAGAVVLDGARNDEVPGPRVWTAETGAVYLPELAGTQLFHVSPDGSLIGSDLEALFRYDRVSGVRTPIGMAPVYGPSSIAISATGTAWIETADTHGDSFLIWRPGRQPKSITCPALCMPVDVSSTGEVALLDISQDPDNGGSLSTWIWSERTGFVELVHFLNAFGVGFGADRLLAVGLSDDARAFAGSSLDITDPNASFRLFYAVLPAAAYQ
ncbi:MAG: hypothetical protein EOO73_18670 [Myxococcales bacterium]|nr:MAG: hypothetical protein EOO73_18670 [Myxococcales bacterium]